MRDDDSLLLAWRGGDKGAGRELFERHYTAVDRFFRNKVGEESGDLTQRTFLGAIESVEADRYRCQNNFRGWLFAIAYRQLCKHYRSRASRGRRFDPGVTSVHDLDPSPSTILGRSEDEQRLLAGLRQLPIDLQVALELHYWEQLSDAQIARVLDVPLGTIKSRIRRGRLLLAERLAADASSARSVEDSLANLECWAARLREQVFGQ
ncbi:RNA polymerase sigma-70 factor [Plesiocystis pacifica SIR-1]|uniref:RNA polymerase sigma-70 factor n=1 Tax=Plesiocystis pacifica SIR-1 TaxID=391625 RepID=A6GAS2_9BACT|nr:sigma-70 family RNA polymerase sigma factor [Plesiocystis pacifica]EDM77013.1 RNA polymerase sigma-70 factor [Plesiocystis pacifica SIR-1]